MLCCTWIKSQSLRDALMELADLISPLAGQLMLVQGPVQRIAA